jgi:hypothetical protein
LAHARDPRGPQSGTLLQMDSTECGTDQKDKHHKTHTHSCARNMFCKPTASTTTSARRTINTRCFCKWGRRREFQVEKNYVKLRTGDSDKERNYVVVSMTARSDGQSDENQK